MNYLQKFYSPYPLTPNPGLKWYHPGDEERFLLAASSIYIDDNNKLNVPRPHSAYPPTQHTERTLWNVYDLFDD